MSEIPVGTSGLPFGAGLFQQTAEGWVDPTTGRRWDAYGNPVQQQQSAPSSGYTLQGSPYATPPAGYAAGALAQNQRTAQGILDRLPDPNKINSASFLRLPKSVQQVVLAGYSAKGYDEGDVAEQIQRMLPTATGPKRGYLAQLG